MIHKYVNEHDAAVTKINLSKFRHIINKRLWGTWTGNPATSDQWSINDVLHNPKTYKNDFNAIKRSDLRYPIIATMNPVKTYTIIDSEKQC